MSATGRRLLILLLVLAAIGAPAAALRIACVGASCDARAGERAAPFCSLPGPVRAAVAAGFREGRSPDAIGVSAAGRPVAAGAGGEVAWPSEDATGDAVLAPLAFLGRGVAPGELPAATLADVAPTLEPLLGIRRPFPGVRSGDPIEGVVRPGARAPLIVVVAWKGVGAADGGTDALIRAVAGRDDVAAGRASPGSLPLDPAALLTTLGTGGLPAEHGITGTLLRDDAGVVVRAWSRHAPIPVIAGLGDDLDEATGGAARIGLVADAPEDRGLIGGTWYGSRDDDDVMTGRDPVGAVRSLLADGYGADGVPDLLGVTLVGDAGRVARTTSDVVSAVLARVPDGVVVIAGTGPSAPEGAVAAETVTDRVEAALGAPVVEAAASTGLFLDQAVVTERRIATQRVVDAMLAEPAAGGGALLADAFPAFAVAFGRYC